MDRSRNGGLRVLGGLIQSARENKGKGMFLRELRIKMKEEGVVMSESLISEYENGNVRNPKPEILRAFAKVLGISYPALVVQYMRAKFGVSPSSIRKHARMLDSGEYFIETETERIEITIRPKI